MRKHSLLDIFAREKWIPPVVSRKTPVPLSPALCGFVKNEKKIAQVLGVDAEKANFLQPFVEEWLYYLREANTPVPVGATHWCGFRDLLEYIDDIKNKIGSTEAKDAAIKYLAPLLSNIGEDNIMTNMLLNFKKNPPIPYIAEYVFVPIGKQEFCYPVLEPSYFLRADASLCHVRDLLSAGNSGYTLGSSFANAFDQYGDKNNLIGFLSERADILRMVLETGKLLGSTSHDIKFGVRKVNDLNLVLNFMDVDMAPKYRKKFLQNALDVTEVLVNRFTNGPVVTANLIKSNLLLFAKKLIKDFDAEQTGFVLPTDKQATTEKWLADIFYMPNQQHITMEMVNGVITVETGDSVVCELEKNFFCEGWPNMAICEGGKRKRLLEFVNALEIPVKNDPEPQMRM